MIVTIDGPAGAGKSSAAKALASRLGFEFLDTGAMYRAVALAATRAGVALADDGALAAVALAVRLEMPPGRVMLDGEDVEGLIRTPEMAAGASFGAKNSGVRRRLAELQRQIAAGRRMVCEGRDQGTVVFPNALCKFYLDASLDERARRRARDLEARGQRVDLAELREQIRQRDEQDANRADSPMAAASDAVRLDSTLLTPEQVVGRMEEETRRRIASGGRPA